MTRRFDPVALNAFRIEGPALVSFSGGRTSALMLRRILDAHDGRLPADVHVVFANTGRERPETLDFVRECADRWDVDVQWIERAAGPHGKRPHADRFRVVDYASASREGEPFAQLIRERNFAPNVVMRFCTQELKIRVMRDFMRAREYPYWTNVVGLRRDETARVVSVKSHSDRERWGIDCPLYDAGVTVADVAAFWRAQPFDLRLKSYEGNCDLCFLKGRHKRERIMRENPELVAWWAEQEEFVGGALPRPRARLRADAGPRPPSPDAADKSRPRRGRHDPMHLHRLIDPVALAPIAVSLASAAVELLAVDRMAHGEWDASLVVAACAAWAGLVLSALAGLALAERRP